MARSSGLDRQPFQEHCRSVGVVGSKLSILLDVMRLQVWACWRHHFRFYPKVSLFLPSKTLPIDYLFSPEFRQGNIDSDYCLCARQSAWKCRSFHYCTCHSAISSIKLRVWKLEEMVVLTFQLAVPSTSRGLHHGAGIC